jgi:predicted phosphate transport protein (TIGR00153 family)
MNVFSKLFGSSPFALVIEHGRKVEECVSRLSSLFTVHFNGRDPEEIERLANQISDLETEADEIRNAVYRALSGKFMIQASRRELVVIVEKQDSMADRAEEIAASLTFRKLKLPDDLTAEVVPFIDIVIQNCALATGVVSKLQLLVKSSFAELDSRTVLKLINELRGRDDLTRDACLAATRALHAAGNTISPIELILWGKILELLAELSAYAKGTADGLQIVIENQRN